MDSIDRPSQVFSQSSRRQRTQLLLAAATGPSLARCVGGVLFLSLYDTCPVRVLCCEWASSDLTRL